MTVTQTPFSATANSKQEQILQGFEKNFLVNEN